MLKSSCRNWRGNNVVLNKQMTRSNWCFRKLFFSLRAPFLHHVGRGWAQWGGQVIGDTVLKRQIHVDLFLMPSTICRNHGSNLLPSLSWWLTTKAMRFWSIYVIIHFNRIFTGTGSSVRVWDTHTQCFVHLWFCRGPPASRGDPPSLLGGSVPPIYLWLIFPCAPWSPFS